MSRAHGKKKEIFIILTRPLLVKAAAALANVSSGNFQSLLDVHKNGGCHDSCGEFFFHCLPNIDGIAIARLIISTPPPFF